MTKEQFIESFSKDSIDLRCELDDIYSAFIVKSKNKAMMKLSITPHKDTTKLNKSKLIQLKTILMNQYSEVENFKTKENIEYRTLLIEDLMKLFDCGFYMDIECLDGDEVKESWFMFNCSTEAERNQ